MAVKLSVIITPHIFSQEYFVLLKKPFCNISVLFCFWVINVYASNIAVSHLHLR